MKPGWLLTLSFVLAPPPPGLRADTVDYLRDVKPLLQERCYACHGALKQKKSLRLDLMGFDDERFIYRHGGRDYRLTDV